MPAIIDDGYTLTTKTPRLPDCEPIEVTYRPSGYGETSDYLEARGKSERKATPPFLAKHVTKWSLPNPIDEATMAKLNHPLATWLVNAITGYEEVNAAAETGN